MAYQISSQPGTSRDDLTESVIEKLDLPADLEKLVLTLNPYDRVYLNWFRQQLYIKSSFDDFVRFRLYFSLDTLGAFAPLSELIKSSERYVVVRQESLESSDPVFGHYCNGLYPLFADRYTPKTVAIINYLYRSDFELAQYQTMREQASGFSSRSLLSASPGHMRSFEQLIEKMIKEQNHAKAIRLINQFPDPDRFLFQLGNCYMKSNQVDQGIEALEKYLNRLSSEKRDFLLEFLGFTYLKRKSNQLKAIYYLDQIGNPSESTRQTVKLLKVLNPVYELNRQTFIESEEQYQSSRQQLLKHLEMALHDPNCGPFELEQPYNAYLLPNMVHAYHNQSNRHLFETIARFYRKLFPSLSYVAPHCENYQSPPPGSRKIKVGFLSNNFKNHSVTHSSSGVILNLDRSKYDVHLITFQASVQKDFMWMVLYSSDSQYLALTGSKLAEFREKIADLKLDILVYCDIGMNTNAYLLSFSRLAPVQILTWGHSDTSGVDTVDYYISSRLFELPDARLHYSERLLLHKSLSTYYYNRLASHQLDLNRTLEHYLIPPGHFLMLISASVQKFHPDFDRTIARILSLCPNARLLVIMSGTKQIGDSNQVKLYQRWEKVIDRELLDRIQFLYHLSYDQFVNLLQLCNLVLDTYPFGSCNTALDAYSVGKVIVACPSRLINGRFVSGFYQKMGLDELVLNSLDQYVEAVVRCYREPLYLDRLEREIKERCHVLYRDAESVSEWDRSFEESLASLTQ
jgi:predicted O-linked N-acetylglucosamine transferase (SPINDLY family)